MSEYTKTKAEQIAETMRKAAPPVSKVRVLGLFIHVIYQSAQERSRIAEMLAAMGCEVRDGQTTPDGTLISGERGRIIYGKSAH